MAEVKIFHDRGRPDADSLVYRPFAGACVGRDRRRSGVDEGPLGPVIGFEKLNFSVPNPTPYM
jgi:hypothetical protein